MKSYLIMMAVRLIEMQTYLLRVSSKRRTAARCGIRAGATDEA